MWEEGMISPEEAEDAAGIPISFQLGDPDAHSLVRLGLPGRGTLVIHS
jgi:hypothetical protein